MADGSPKTPPTQDLYGAFSALYRQHAGMVRRALRQLGVPATSLDDAVQDVFVVLHRRIDDFERDRSLKNWLWGIARGVASGYRRSTHRRERLHAALPTPQATDSPERGIARHQAAAVLDRFLGSLDADKCAVFVLSEIEGRRGPEIAELLDVNVNTVYARLRAARQRFQAAMVEHRTASARPMFAALFPWTWPAWGKPAVMVGAMAALVMVPPSAPPTPDGFANALQPRVAINTLPEPGEPRRAVAVRTAKPRAATATTESPEFIDDEEIGLVLVPGAEPRPSVRATRRQPERLAQATPVSAAPALPTDVFEPVEVVGPPPRAPWRSDIVGRPAVRHPTLLSPRQDFIDDLLRIVTNTL